MKLAAIDIGSNSIHMVIVDATDKDAFEVVDREKEMVKLGASAFHAGVLTEEAIEAGVDVIGRFMRLAQSHKVEKVLAVATSAVREASNGGDFLTRIEDRTGLVAMVISGEVEAQLIRLAVGYAVDLRARRALILDIGGGSVEISVGDAASVELSHSLKLGVQRLRALVKGEDPLTRSTRRELDVFVQEEAESVLRDVRRVGFDIAVGTSGTILALGQAALAESGVDRWRSPNSQMVSTTALRTITDRLVGMTPAQRTGLPGIDERRADTIHLGGLLLCSLLEQAGVESIKLCSIALREGVILDYLHRKQHRLTKAYAKMDIRERSVTALARRFGQVGPHAACVRELSLSLFDQLEPLHALSEHEREVLAHAAQLHDVGQQIHYDRHEHHAYYLIRNAHLRGFRDDEIEMIALIGLYHRKAKPKRRDHGYADLSAEQRTSVRMLAGILRIAEGLDRTHFQLVDRVSVIIGRRLGDGERVPNGSDHAPGERNAPVILRVHAKADAELELWAARRKCALLEKALSRTIVIEVAPGVTATHTSARLPGLVRQ